MSLPHPFLHQRILPRGAVMIMKPPLPHMALGAGHYSKLFSYIRSFSSNCNAMILGLTFLLSLYR